MDSITAQPWFWWTVALIGGLPVLIIVLGELHARLDKRGNALAKPVGLLRNFILPVAALLVLLWLLRDELGQRNLVVDLVATVFGFLVLLFVLSTLNAALFHNAEEGSWRERMPSIFVDLVRMVLIVVGIAILISVVWDVNVGGTFAALGVTGIVVGLALQNAVGGIISGLLLLFEQPFKIGDWLDTGTVRGRVVEVNWRAVHIQGFNEVHVVPNAALAAATFANMSRPTEHYTEYVTTSFRVEDDPAVVCEVLTRVAADLRQCDPDEAPVTRPTGAGTYMTSIPLLTYPDVFAARATFLTNAWFASRRAGLRIDRAIGRLVTRPIDEASALRQVGSALFVSDENVPELTARVTVEEYGPGETVHRAAEVLDAVHIVIAGTVQLSTDGPAGQVEVGTASPGDFVGLATLTREPSAVTVRVSDDLPVTLLRMPRTVLEELIRAEPRLAGDIADMIDKRREQVAEARSMRQVAPELAEAQQEKS